MNFLTSFFLYLFIYSITISAAYWAEYSLKKWDSRLITVHDNVRKLHINGNAIIGLAIIIIIPSIFAGLRSDNVGADVIGYGRLIMQQAEKVDTFRELNYIDRTYTEFGYRLYAFLASRLFRGTGWWLFFTQLFIMLFLVWSIYLFREDISIWKSMAVFMFCNYHISFTMMRQTMAMVILLFAFYFLIKGKYIRYVLLSIMASGFHTFAFVVALIIFFLWKMKTCYQKRRQIIVIVVMSIILALSWKFIMNFLSLLFVGYLQRYARYFNETEGIPVLSLITSPAFIINIFLFLTAAYILKHGRGKRTYYDNTLYMISLFGILCTYLQIHFVTIYRMGRYFLFFYIIYLSRTFSFRFRYGRRTRTGIFLIVLFIYWFCDCMLSGHSSTAIFEFRF